ncbi:MAG: hypothetical protein K2H52_08290 [Lachnospiraceae bacterium]|nr:hypothetical protein [Lachnospiraceae bacterium]
MNIILEGAETKTAQTHVNAGTRTTSYRTPQETEKTESGGFALDISGTVMDNSAYAGHGRTAEEIMLAAGQEDITVQRNYMAVMSNTMSDEDFAKLQKEGFHPGSTDIETVVTIVDHIKTALLKGGEQITGYTDTVSDDAIRDITGSEAFTEELKKQFARRDIPLTEENITAVTKAFHMLTEAGTPSDGSVKYMIENDLSPTPENFYTAKYSALDDTDRQGRGYYAAGGVAGYYAKKPEQVDFEQLRPQMEKVIEEAGYIADEENLQNARWLVEKGIPLNAETFSLLCDIKKQQFPITYEAFAATAACAIADGTAPVKADLGKESTFAEEAADLVEKTASIEAEAADVILARDLPLTLKNLLAAQDEIFGRNGRALETKDLTENIRGRRLLEEVRLSMTIEANIRLLRSGYQIETASLEALITKLKEAESSFAKALTGQIDASEAEEKKSLYQETLKTLQGISASPAAILAEVSSSDNLREIYAYGNNRRLAYEKAGQTYEALMTAPRRDMGDSIQKAFRNVDDILKDMDLELSDANRRAVRILGYNSLEITEDNIREIRDKDDLLGSVVKEMKPGRVLNMIREGVNPLTMSLDELKDYFNQQADTADEMESYSRFLYKLENQKGITEEERSAYIGIYRLVHQVEKADDAAIGALWQAGGEFTLGNLLSALRSSKRGRMDYSVDDTFGGVNARDTGRESITDQIAKGFTKQELEQFLDDTGSDRAGEEFDRMMYEQVRAAVKSEETVLKYLSDYNQPVSADYLMAAGALLKNPKEIWKEFDRLNKQDKTDDVLEGAGEEIIDHLVDQEGAQKAYQGFVEKLQGMMKNMAFSDSYAALDVRTMSVLYKQISFMGNMAREENYEIPTDVGGVLTSINLKIIHNDAKESKVAITFESELIGKTAAEFKMTKQGLSGFGICGSKDGCRLLNDNKDILERKLKGEKIQVGEIYFAVGENLDMTEFSLKETQNRKTGNDSQMLYKAAKAFIGYVQEIGMKKGNTAYENQL